MLCFARQQILFAFLGIVLCLGVSPLVGQEAAELKKKIEAQKEKEFSKWKVVFQKKLSNQITEIKRTCGLNEKQVKRLKLGAKGAISSVFRKIDKTLQSQDFGGAGVEVLVAPGGVIVGGPDDQTDDAADDEDQADGQEVPRLDDDFNAGGVPINDVPAEFFADPYVFVQYFEVLDREKVWVKTVSKVLSAEQAKKYEVVTNERRKFRLATRINTFLANADSGLVLSIEQRKKLFVYVEKKYGKSISRLQDVSYYLGVDAFANASLQAIPGENELQNKADDAGKPKAKVSVDEEIAKILNKDQQFLWQERYQRVLEEIKMAATQPDNLMLQGAVPFGE